MQLPDFSYEQKAWDRGYGLVIGVDEVGRGSLAGPVVAGACLLKAKVSHSDPDVYREKNLVKRSSRIRSFAEAQDDIIGLGINDSKKLSAKKREELDSEIKKHFHWGIGEASVVEINRVGIVKATEKAMRRAIFRVIPAQAGIRILDCVENDKIYYATGILPNSKYFLLLDAFPVPYVKGIGLKNQTAIIKGDEKSISIAAGSIIAKVYRDELMVQLSEQHPNYQWEKNKGYGTSNHIDAIKRNGITNLHRTKFVDSIR